MSFGGPPPNQASPSGPFDQVVSNIAGSPYTIAAAIFLLNVGGRFLPMELSKEQEKFMQQPWFRRLIIFVIFFVATRNIIIAGTLSLLVILFVGYLFNENSSMCLFGKGGNDGGTCKTQTTLLSPEEQDILKKLTEKQAKQQEESAKPFKLADTKGLETHTQYQKVLRGLWTKFAQI
jgi:hypothetical protein